MTRFDRAINKVIFDCLNLQKNESLLVLTDESSVAFANLFIKKAVANKIEAYQLLVPARALSGDEVSSICRNFITCAQAIILITSPPLIHSKIIQHACHNGKRLICLGELDPYIFENSMKADLEMITRKSLKIADILSIGKFVEVRTKAGCDFSFRISRHKGNINHGCARNPGEYGILPAGEAYVIPDKNSFNGTIVIDGSIPELGLLLETGITLHVKNGHISQIIGDEMAAELRKRIKPFGKSGRIVAEFGVGTNPAVRLTGKSIVDEKKLGTAHIALGDHLLEGGSTRKKLHLDLIFKNPTISVDGRQLMVAGKLID